MPYTRVPLADFIALYPAFAAVTDAQYDFWASQAELLTVPHEDCLGAQMQLATMLATADLLVKAGIGAGAESVAEAQGMGGFKKIKSGTLELERADSSSINGSSIYGQTQYGRQLYPMIRVCLSGPLVTGTGSLPPCGLSRRGW